MKEFINDYCTIKVRKCLCSLATFKINGMDAEEEDFKEYARDIGRDNAEPYCCGNMVFKAKFPTTEILNKYSITLEQYKVIADALEDLLSFGSCGWCS
jgi:hypothetical protein